MIYWGPLPQSELENKYNHSDNQSYFYLILADMVHWHGNAEIHFVSISNPVKGGLTAGHREPQQVTRD